MPEPIDSVPRRLDHTETLRVEHTLPRTRLDSFLHQRFPCISRNTIQRLIREAAICVDGRAVKPTHHPVFGEVVTIDWPDPKPPTVEARPIPLAIVYEDNDLLVLNKPAGMVVHPAAGTEDNTLVNALLYHCAGQLSGVGGVARPGIVHRLDQHTSGLMVVAKHDTAHLSLSYQFSQRRVEKRYHAIACGHVLPAQGQIDAAIARHPNHRKVMTVLQGGRSALTSYHSLERLNAATLLEVRLHTGRTHQVRVHFKYLGFPLVGDVTYGRRQNARLEEVAGVTAPRQMLHARCLAFTHPVSRALLRFEAPWPADFVAVLEALRGGGG